MQQIFIKAIDCGRYNIASDQITIDNPHQEGETALHKACKMCNYNVLKSLIDYARCWPWCSL